MLTLEKLLSTPTTQLGKASRFVVFQIKLWSHCARLLKLNRASQQAAALSYYTIFGIVPLAIVILLLFQSISAQGIGQNVKALVYKHLELSGIRYSTSDGQEVLLTDHLDAIVQQFFDGLNKGSLTILSAVIVIWAALALLSRIEKAFNNIWHVGRGRGFLQRVINYWAILTLGPLLIGLGVYLSSQYEPVSKLEKTLLSLSTVGPLFVSYFIAVVVLFLLYYVLPNTKVHAKAAICGALAAALVWMLAKWGFGKYVTEFIPYSKVYGVVGLVPLAVLWIFVTWLIVLFGLQLTFTTQHLKSLDAADIAAAQKTEEYFIANDLTAINIVREIVAAFEDNQAPVQAEELCSNLDIPAEFGQKILDHLVTCGLIVKTSEPVAGYLPAREPERIKLSDVAEALASASLAQSTDDGSSRVQQAVQSQRNALAQFNVRQIIRGQKTS
ncbi:MAG: YihY family inner membrane protein [Phycisphaerales bacterium]|nr:MAG: YihY family inner membrane protein [Phycisphaerales bacterium]